MYQIDFHKPLHIHFIGIGGISMSGLAEILLGEDFKVSGSDSKESPLTDSLTRKGARIFYGQRASNITDDVELVVYTAAIHPDNPEYASAVEKGIPMLTRAQLLGQIMRNYDTPIAVSWNPWQDHHYFHDLPDSSGSRCGSDHQCWRHSSFYRGKYPSRSVRNICHRSL